MRTKNVTRNLRVKLASHEIDTRATRAAEAWQDGRFADEVVPVEIKSRRGVTVSAMVSLMSRTKASSSVELKFSTGRATCDCGRAHRPGSSWSSTTHPQHGVEKRKALCSQICSRFSPAPLPR